MSFRAFYTTHGQHFERISKTSTLKFTSLQKIPECHDIGLRHLEGLELGELVVGAEGGYDLSEPVEGLVEAVHSAPLAGVRREPPLPHLHRGDLLELRGLAPGGAALRREPPLLLPVPPSPFLLHLEIGRTIELEPPIGRTEQLELGIEGALFVAEAVLAFAGESQFVVSYRIDRFVQAHSYVLAQGGIVVDGELVLSQKSFVHF